MLKTLEPTGDLCIKFTEEELVELGINEGDKFNVLVNADGSLTLERAVPRGTTKILEMLFRELLDIKAFPENKETTPEKAKEYLHTIGFKVSLEALRGVFGFIEQLRKQT